MLQLKLHVKQQDEVYIESQTQIYERQVGLQVMEWEGSKADKTS